MLKTHRVKKPPDVPFYCYWESGRQGRSLELGSRACSVVSVDMERQPCCSFLQHPAAKPRIRSTREFADSARIAGLGRLRPGRAAPYSPFGLGEAPQPQASTSRYETPVISVLGRKRYLGHQHLPFRRGYKSSSTSAFQHDFFALIQIINNCQAFFRLIAPFEVYLSFSFSLHWHLVSPYHIER